jgi:hypothetical protein
MLTRCDKEAWEPGKFSTVKFQWQEFLVKNSGSRNSALEWHTIGRASEAIYINEQFNDELAECVFLKTEASVK